MNDDPFAAVAPKGGQADPFADVTPKAGAVAPANVVSGDPFAAVGAKTSDPFGDVVPRGTIQTEGKPIGWDYSTEKPAKTWYGALGNLLKPQGINVPGSILHGLKQAIFNPETEAGAPTTWAGRAKEGLEQMGQGGQAFSRLALDTVAPGQGGSTLKDYPALLKVPGGLFEALGLNQAQTSAGKAMGSMAPPVSESPSVAANAVGALPGSVLGPTLAQVLTDPTLLYGWAKGAVKGAQALKQGAESLASTWKPPDVNVDELLNYFKQVPDSGFAAEIRAKTTGESGPNSELPGSGYEPPVQVKGSAGTPVTEWDQAAIARGDLVKGPAGGPEWVPRGQTSDEVMKDMAQGGPAPAKERATISAEPQPSTYNEATGQFEKPAEAPRVKPEIAPDPRPAAEKMAESENATPEVKAQTAATNIDQDVQAAAAVSKKGVPKLSELAPEAMRADQQEALDGFAEASQMLQGKSFLDTRYARTMGTGLDYLNPQTSMVAGRAAEQLNRASEAVISMQPEYNKMLQGAIDVLKKPTGLAGRFIRDTEAEKNVARALNGVIQKTDREVVNGVLMDKPRLVNVGREEAVKLLTPEEQKAFGIIDEVNKKLAKLEGRDISGEQVKDYWYRTLGKDHPMVKALAEKGILYDPFTGNIVKPTKAAFDLARDPESARLDWNYDLYDVMQQRIGVGIRKAIMDPIITDISRSIDTKAASGEVNSKVQHYVHQLLDRMQGRPGVVDAVLDDALKHGTDWMNQFIPSEKAPILKPVTQALEALGMPGNIRRAQQVVSRAYYRAYIGLNLATAVKDLSKNINAMGALGVKNTAQGAGEFGRLMTSPEGRAAFAKLGITGDTEQAFRGLQDLAAKRGLLKGIDKGLFGPHQMVELLDRGVSYYAAYQEGAAKFAAKGVKPAPWMLDRYARGMTDMVNFKYGPQNINPYLNNSIGKLYYQFASAPSGQLNFMRRLQQMDSATNRTIGIGNAQVSNRVLKTIMLQGLIGYGLKKGLDVDVRDLLGWTDQVPVLGKLPFHVPVLGTALEVGSRATGGIIPGSNNMPSPATQATGIISPNAKNEQNAKQSLMDMLLGLGRVPALAMRKGSDLSNELQTGQVLNKQGNAAYNVTPAEAWKKFFGLRSSVQQDYIERAREYANRGK